MMPPRPAQNLAPGLTLLLAAAAAAAAGCSLHPKAGGYYEDDGPPATTFDVARLPDAVPRAEPPARTGNQPYVVEGRMYYPLATAAGYRERGVASWYGRKFHGRLTSSGEPYDMYAMTAAHRTLPLPSYVRVTNLENGRSVVVRVNDRGPFKPNRLIDLSYAAAAKLGIVERGTGLVEVEAIEPGATPPSPAIATAAGGAPDRKPRAGIEIISPAEAAPPPSPVARAPVRLYVQAGAFLQAENAEGLRARLAQVLDQPVFVHRATGEDGRPWLRVRIGPLASVEEADRLSAQLTAHGVPNALIVVE